MRVLSLFSGVGGFDLGLERAGFEVVAQCDNDAFCNKVLAKHWPEVRRFDDVRNIGAGLNGRQGQGRNLHGPDDSLDSGHAVERGVDLVCGGFPCQDLSVAGKRAGLDGDRSGLWFEFKRILSELRPRWAIIENVPGLLSSNQGRDFAIILDGLGECGFGGISWAVLDSQHFGVAQRRRRVYVVAGPSRRSVEQVLSLCESCGGHPQTRRTPGEVAPQLLASGPPGSRRDDEASLIANPLGAHHPRNDLDNETYGFDALEDGTGRGTPLTVIGLDEEFNASEDQIGTLKAKKMSGGHEFAVAAGASVRRLTPVECERLQGFPDGWTDLGNTPDGPRYKAMGNAVSVPVIEWLGRRIMAVHS